MPLPVSNCAKSEQMPERIGLAALNISCQRGGRVVFTRPELLRLRPARRCWSPGLTARARPACCARLPASCRSPPATSASRAQAPMPNSPSFAIMSATLNAVKTSLSVGREPRLLGGVSRRRWRQASTPALGAFGLTPLADLPAGLLSAGQKRKLALSRLFAARARSGCSTSRKPRSTPPRSSCWTPPSRRISTLAASPSSPAMWRSRPNSRKKLALGKERVS